MSTSHCAFAPGMTNPSAHDGSEPDADGQRRKSRFFLFLCFLIAYFRGWLPNYFPGRLCPAVPFCNHTEAWEKPELPPKALRCQEKPWQGRVSRPWDHRGGGVLQGATDEWGFGFILAAWSYPGARLQPFLASTSVTWALPSGTDNAAVLGERSSAPSSHGDR